MDSMDDESRQFRDALRGVLGADTSSLPSGVDADWRRAWPRLTELGVTALCVPEEVGGFGFRADVACAAARELGAALHGSPFAGLTASAYALSRSSSEPAVALARDIAAGERICCFGLLGTDSGAYQVDGADAADALVLFDSSRHEITVLDDPAHWSATADAHPFDISRGCASVTITVDAGERFAAAAHAGELYRLLLCADTVGGLERVLDRTVRYAGERHAFGRAIGAFQAVQHRLVDHAIRVRGMSLLVGEAAHALQAGEPAQSVALAELSVHASAPRILHDLLQLTGAIGFSWEYGLHFYERRAHQNARLAANPRAAARSLAHAEGWLDAH